MGCVRHSYVNLHTARTLAQLRACPIEYPGQRTPLLDLEIHTASGARLSNMMEDVW